MLFWLTLVIFIIGIILLIIDEKHCYRTDFVWNSGLTSVILSSIGLFIMVIILLCSYCGINGFIAENTKKYESLTYQYENNLYENDNDLGKKELMDEIREWNEDLAYNKATQKDFWIGIFIPNVYDQFEFIELAPVNRGE